MTMRTTFGPITVIEQVWQDGTRQVRPLQSHGLTHLGYTLSLQRAVTDFGIEESFEHARQRLKEHYHIDVPLSAVRTLTEDHARRAPASTLPAVKRTGEAAVIVTSMDGTMIPTVRMAEGPEKDARKRRTSEWREAKLCFAQDTSLASASYEVTFGDAASAGNRWRAVVEQAGLGAGTHVHAVCDGAPWIEAQFRTQFGRQQRQFLVDFFHISERLALVKEETGRTVAWLHRQQGHLLAGKPRKMLAAVRALVEPPGLPREEAPVREACGYLEHQVPFMDYVAAKARSLPIGSGQIEGSHRSILHKRLKISGAWWTHATAESMAYLRVLRANNQWESFWRNTFKAAIT